MRRRRRLRAGDAPGGIQPAFAGGTADRRRFVSMGEAASGTPIRCWRNSGDTLAPCRRCSLAAFVCEEDRPAFAACVDSVVAGGACRL